MKIAIVHDQLKEFGGAERVLVALKHIFPNADVFTSLYNLSSLGSHAKLIKDWPINTSWADKLYITKKWYSPLRFITPWVWESFDFSKYDLVISSSGSYMSKGIITRPETIHICYLHHQPRYLYYYETAIEWQKYLPVKIYGHLINHCLRIWDYLSSQRVDHFIANSEETKKRIQKFYRRDATVIYPPVNIPLKGSLRRFTPRDDSGYYLTVSRLARAKHVDILIQAANKYGFNIKIVGSGRDEQYLRSIAGYSVEFVGNISDQKLSSLYQKAKAFLFTSVDEEFGIAPVEAMGYGMPVIAYRSGGVPETVQDNINGYLFEKLTPESLIQKIKKLESLSDEDYKRLCKGARSTSERFSESNFKKQILAFVKEKFYSSPRGLILR